MASRNCGKSIKPNDRPTRAMTISCHIEQRYNGSISIKLFVTYINKQVKKHFAVTITGEKLMLPTGFEPMSTARRAVMIGRYTTGATYILVGKYPQEY